jgi:hypothetical protein
MPVIKQQPTPLQQAVARFKEVEEARKAFENAYFKLHRILHMLSDEEFAEYARLTGRIIADEVANG